MFCLFRFRQQFRFNSLAPRGANPERFSSIRSQRQFQLTRPAGGEPFIVNASGVIEPVSTHSPRGGRTNSSPPLPRLRRSFNSLAPRGANRGHGYLSKWTCTVSTHSPRGGRTSCSFSFFTLGSGFNSLAPRGANRARGLHSYRFRQFQLTRPAGGEPCRIKSIRCCWQVSTHSPRGGRTFV